MSTRSEKINVLIADDHPIFRLGLADVIERSGNMQVVIEAENGADALDSLRTVMPDVAIVDIEMPIIDGIETAKRLRAVSPRTPIIFLTMYKDWSIVRSMEKLKVKGYVLKDSAMNEIVECIETVLAGKTYLSRELIEFVVGDSTGLIKEQPPVGFGELTPAERKVLVLVADSRSNREIAKELFISVRTVETHRHNVCSKLKLSGPHTLLKFAVRNKVRILSELSA